MTSNYRPSEDQASEDQASVGQASGDQSFQDQSSVGQASGDQSFQDQSSVGQSSGDQSFQDQSSVGQSSDSEVPMAFYFIIEELQTDWLDAQIKSPGTVNQLKAAIKETVEPKLNHLAAYELILKAKLLGSECEPVKFDGTVDLASILNYLKNGTSITSSSRRRRPNPVSAEVRQAFAENVEVYVYLPPAPVAPVSISSVFAGGTKRPFEDLDSEYNQNFHDRHLQGVVFISSERLDEIDRCLTNSPAQITCLRSPPASGKTIFTKLFQKYLYDMGHNVVRISMTTLDVHSDENNFDEYWKNNSYSTWESPAHMTWNEIRRCTTQIDVIVDEAQILYSGMSFFWKHIKVLMQERINQNLRILFVSMYEDAPNTVEATPIDFSYTLGLDNLRLRRNEFESVVENYASDVLIKEELVMDIPLNVKDAVFKSTGGHCGLVKYTLGLLKDQYRLGKRVTNNIIDYLISPGFFTAIASSRAFIWIWKWDPTPDDVSFLVYALCNISGSAFSVDASRFNRIAFKLTRSGMITTSGAADSGKLQFVAPLVRIILEQRIFTTRLTGLDRTKNNFDTFLRLSIQRMRPSLLAKSLSRGKNETDRLHERMWQMEWYRAATTAVPLVNSISPDVGPVFDSPGLLDFYVNGHLNWGVELLREGQKMKEHSDRFEDAGEYKNIPFKQYAILDFRHFSKDVKQCKDHFWHVLYTDDFKKVYIRRKNCQEECLRLLGDEMLNHMEWSFNQ